MLNGIRQSQRTCRRGPLALSWGSHGGCTHCGDKTGPAGGRKNSPGGENTSYLTEEKSTLVYEGATSVTAPQTPTLGASMLFRQRQEVTSYKSASPDWARAISVLHLMRPDYPVHNCSVKKKSISTFRSHETVLQGHTMQKLTLIC